LLAAKRAFRYLGGVTTLKAHFDGKVLVPDEAVNLPLNCPLELHIRPVSTASAASESPNGSGTALRRLASLAKRLPTDPNAPTDGSQQHDHYLYRTAKR